MGAAIDWERIEAFVGYGRVDAPVVFLGMEEGQTNPANLLADILHRARFDQIMDLQETHEGIHGADRYFDAANGATQRPWRPMCDLMIRRENAGGAPDRRSRLEYQSHRLGSVRGDSLLTELLPYPKRIARTWPELYEQRFQTRVLYELGMLQRRTALLAGVFAQHPRDLIVCYGKGNWDRYKELMKAAFNVGAQQWEPAMPFEGEHGALIASVGNTRVLLVKHFCCSQFNSEAQLERLSAAAL